MFVTSPGKPWDPCQVNGGYDVAVTVVMLVANMDMNIGSIRIAISFFLVFIHCLSPYVRCPLSTPNLGLGGDRLQDKEPWLPPSGRASINVPLTDE